MDTAAIVIPIVVVVVLLVLLVLYLWVSYNALVTLRTRVDEAWRDITVQRRDRAELIPPLVQSVQAYATHEPAVFVAASEARDESLAATTPAEATRSESHVQQAIRSVIGTADAYPQLSSSPVFLQMQSDLGEADDRIQASRRFYNGGVREFNTKVQVFPGSVFARRPGFGAREFFEVSDGPAVAEPPRIQF